MARVTALSFIVPVSDLDRAAQFYKKAFGLEEAFRNEQIVFMGLPGTDAAVGLVLNTADAGAGPRRSAFAWTMRSAMTTRRATSRRRAVGSSNAASTRRTCHSRGSRTRTATNCGFSAIRAGRWSMVGGRWRRRFPCIGGYSAKCTAGGGGATLFARAQPESRSRRALRAPDTDRQQAIDGANRRARMKRARSEHR